MDGRHPSDTVLLSPARAQCIELFLEHSFAVLDPSVADPALVAEDSM